MEIEQGKAIVRQHVERIDGVSGTRFEWDWSHGAAAFSKTLVVEVNFPTDPNDHGFRQSVLDAIRDTAAGVLENETAMVISHLKIVPRVS